MPNMVINCCSFRKARVFLGLRVHIDSDSYRIKKDYLNFAVHIKYIKSKSKKKFYSTIFKRQGTTV